MPLSNENITIHIGMPKSASTTLQQHFFMKLQNVHYFGHESQSDGTELFLDIIKKEDSYFQAESNENHLEEITNDGRPVIMSSEFASSYLTPLAKGLPQSRTIICERLASLAPQSKIIIILRNQYDLHRSIFAQLLRNESDVLDYKNFHFEEWLDKNILLAEQHWQSVFELADYRSLIEVYKKNFKHVYIYLFEEIIQDMKGFVENDLVNLMGLSSEQYVEPYQNIASNARHNRVEIGTEKFLVKTARIMKYKMGNPMQFVPKSIRQRAVDQTIRSAKMLDLGHIETKYTERHKKYIREYYKDSNIYLADQLNKDLSLLGYPV